MDRLYELFKQAPHFGSLIDPSKERGDLHDAGYSELHPLLSKALHNKRTDFDLTSIGVVAQGLTKAAKMLSEKYSLVITNVPYLVRGKQKEILQDYLEKRFGKGMQDLATAFIARSQDMTSYGGTIAAVTPQAWLSLSRYIDFRKTLLQTTRFGILARLGAGAFETITGEVVKVGLYIIHAKKPSEDNSFSALDLTKVEGASAKDRYLQSDSLLLLNQIAQHRNPDSRVVFGESEDVELLQQYANAWQGIATSDFTRFGRYFWELPQLLSGWRYQQSTPDETKSYGGRESILFWEDGHGKITDVCQKGATFRGQTAWGKLGIAVAQMTNLVATLYSGEIFDNNVAVITAFNPEHTDAIWCFCQSDDFATLVRKIDDKLNVTNATLSKVPFDLSYWQKVASEKYPNGLPEPHSDDPTQWIFKGDIATSTEPLQVAVARLLGYRWPEQPTKADLIDKLTDDDGIVCIPGVRGEATASERLREMLQSAYATKWSDSLLHQLLTDAGCKAGTTLEDWLRNTYFEQHFKHFHNRPFIWQIWDGRKDGFSCLVNYHKLTHKNLENLTYSYLGDWIKAQSAETKAGRVGADLRLAAAQDLQEKLKLILAGEKPYDILVRWKPLAEQAIGWHPDLNDGVRMNIRPFVEAGVLRKNPNIKWTKDRGKEPEREKDDYPWFWDGKTFTGERVNDVHLTNAEKLTARKAKGKHA